MPSLKEDASFVEFLAMGAVATERAIELLNSNGHDIIELERGALSSRLWENKEKRLRVPDLLCLNCGRRIESRGKKNLEITMSHSISDDERAWDYDVENEDWVALVQCYKTGERPRDCEAADVVNIVSIEKLRETVDQTKQERGGPSQGSELTITWPSTTASADGFVKQITDSNRLQIKRESDGYTLSYSLEKKISDDKYVTLTPLVESGDKVRGESQIIAAPFEVLTGDNLQCSNDHSPQDFVDDLHSDSFTNRFAAIKALGYLHDENGIEEMKTMLNDPEVHPFAKIEAASSLARQCKEDGWEYIRDVLDTDTDVDANKRLEITILLSEIENQNTVNLLTKILMNDSEIDEIRAEAAHSLGVLDASSALADLINGFETDSPLIQRDCMEAVSKIISGTENTLVQGLRSNKSDRKLGCAIALADAGTDVVKNIIDSADKLPKDGISIAIALSDKSSLKYLLEKDEFDDQISFAATTMSTFFNSWADTLTEDIRYELRLQDEEEEEEMTEKATLN